MIKGIIFDMDGVVIDSSHAYFEAWNDVFKRKFNVQISKVDFASQFGASAKDFTNHFIKKFSLNVDNDELTEEIIRTFNAKYRQNVELKKGIKEAFLRLKETYKTALATGANKDWAIYILTKLGIFEYFDYIIAGNEVKIAKPEPEIFLKAAEVLKLKPEECAVIEDAELGLIAAKRAGMLAISIPDEFTKHQDHSIADIHLKSISELNDEILEGGKNG
jgi:HAD superfamily hydrolase (TIGR01509 family)